MLFCITLAAWLSLVAGGFGAEQPLADLTIVVYNKAVPESVELAKFYAEKRGIAPDHLIGLDCSTEEEITREQYDATIAGPLRAVFSQRHWWTVNERKSTRLNSSHRCISYAVFCLKKKKKKY